jgi:hypothetical protein
LTQGPERSSTLSDASASPIVYLLPNEAIPSTLVLNTPVAYSRSLKSILLERQTQLLLKENTDAFQKTSLLAYFSKRGIADDYRKDEHFKLRLPYLTKSCDISCTEGYYFSDAANSADATSASSIDGQYDVHVDFANKCFGGAWRGEGYAQEEIAFIENAGLGTVTEYASNANNKTYAGRPIDDPIVFEHQCFRSKFLTRQLKKSGVAGTPLPILVEGCVRVGRFIATLRGPSRTWL